MAGDEYIPDTNNCYNAGLTSNLSDLFYIQTLYFPSDSKSNYLDQCKKNADASNASFFLVSDFNYNQNILNSNYKCYIPKPHTYDETKYNYFYDGLIRPMKEFEEFSNNFVESNINFQYMDFRNNKILELSNTCFYTTNNMHRDKKLYFGVGNKFVLYKNEFTDQIFNNTDYSNYNTLVNLQTYTHYKALKDNFTSEISIFLETFKESLNNLLKIDRYKYNTSSFFRPREGCTFYDERNNDITGPLKSYMNNAFNLDTSFNSLNNSFIELQNNIKKLSNLVKKTYGYNISEKLLVKQNELNSLLGFDGANNAKLHDTTLLKQFKLSENIILILIMILSIFFYIKKIK